MSERKRREADARLAEACRKLAIAAPKPRGKRGAKRAAQKKRRR